MKEQEKYATTFYTTKDVKTEALKIAKKKGIHTLNGLLNILIADFVEKNREILERK
ncbi:hypothetical protein ThvES_00003500 [Thiovulum sp. ES]|nr:hypothetical protein ThvES_00003500 [Thiovulum sp. ES]